MTSTLRAEASPQQTASSCCTSNVEANPAWALQGRWDPIFYLPNVAIYTHVLPNGTVLFWGRRDRPDGSMDEHECTPFVWDPQQRTFFPTPQPMLGDRQTKVNLFCGGHAFLPDGKLLAAGGHLRDTHGDNQACTYDYRTNTWTPLDPMNNGRWYPSVLSLADGTTLVCSGSYFDGVRATPQNAVPQVHDGQEWHSLSPPYDQGGHTLLALYPRWHVISDGRVFVTGPNATGLFFDTAGKGTWTPAPSRTLLARDYAPSVMYDLDKIIYIGGGNDQGSDRPTNGVEIIDLGEAQPQWRRTADMHFRRRHHNGTLLPDGTVLVTGGTQGPSFNSLDPGEPVHFAELWDPKTKAWTLLAAEDVDRCYHGTAVLLPDATVLSAGGGEGGNDPNPSHREAQIFHPPYLFRGPRPEIRLAPGEIGYDEEFQVEVSAPDVGLVTWIWLSSVTHAFNQNQRINFLEFSLARDGLRVRSPKCQELCPPGHYMLFVMSKAGVPSHAHIICIGAGVSARRERADQETTARYHVHIYERDRAVKAESTGTRVLVGLTANCPYGVGACWGPAYEALKTLADVAAVAPIPSAEHSTAEVYLTHRGLPQIERWPEQFARSANGSYDFRGVEVTVTGTIEMLDGTLRLVGRSFDGTIALKPLSEGQKLQWDHRSRQPHDAASHELNAYAAAVQHVRDRSSHDMRVTGPLIKRGAEWILFVRMFEL